MSNAPLSTLIALPLTKQNAQAVIDLVIEEMCVSTMGSSTLSGSGNELRPYGYVICAGGRYARYGYATCRWIREVLKDDAPIEVWVGSNEFANEWMDIPSEQVPHVTIHKADIPGGWPLKARAVMKSSFQKVILLDADCLPLIPAAELWDKPFMGTGALFFPDVGNHRKSDWGYQALKLKAGSLPEMEAGQVAIDRCRHAKAVMLTDYFNQHPEFFYSCFLGDKDLWSLAFARLGIPFTTGNKCHDRGWGLAHYLPDGTHYSDHLIRVKQGASYPSLLYQYFLVEYDSTFSKK